MRKADIANCAIAETPLDAADLVRRPHGRYNVLVYRHVWRPNMDARVLMGVSRVVCDEAQKIANRTGKPVEIYNSDDTMADQIHPET